MNGEPTESAAADNGTCSLLLNFKHPVAVVVFQEATEVLRLEDTLLLLVLHHHSNSSSSSDVLKAAKGLAVHT